MSRAWSREGGQCIDGSINYKIHNSITCIIPPAPGEIFFSKKLFFLKTLTMKMKM